MTIPCPVVWSDKKIVEGIGFKSFMFFNHLLIFLGKDRRKFHEVLSDQGYFYDDPETFDIKYYGQQQ